MSIKTLILAAGQGTRMRSKQPKVLHKISHRSLLEHVYRTCRLIEKNQIIIIYGHGGEQVKQALPELQAQWVEQKQQLGTGHAVLQAMPLLADTETVLIVYGDVPLLTDHSIQQLLKSVSQRSMGLLTVILKNPQGYGRIIRDAENKILNIIEQKEANAAQQAITEVNTGIMAVQAGMLKKWLANLNNDNSQNEFYLTDIIAMAVNEGIDIQASQPANPDEVLGVNNRQQLSYLERVYQRQQANKLMQQGVTLLDPSRFDCRGHFTHIGQDVSIDINVIFEGENSIGHNVTIGANTIIKNAVIADNVEILANCIIDNAKVGAGSRIGPFARLRPHAELSEQVYVGNFVEIKKSTVAQGSKINHLSYIGDASIGSGVNIGAGTITCNYDGVNKFRTVIEDGAFIGSDTQLIAPVTIGKNATIGAGSTITKDTPEAQLTLSRAKQISIIGWSKPQPNKNK